MKESASVLFANDAFYLAFANQNFKEMRSIWATRTSVTCIHPGWDVLSDLEEVLDSWKDILASPTATNIVCKNPIVRVHGNFAYVVCFEILDQGFLVATNVFILEDGLWKMVHHQAGATPPPENHETDNQETVQ
jgi:hypothetical protein|tara:strand:- start:199 stop:600 length:402 start_codon:yes stop_codon:yes gene_type:complete